MSKRILIVIVIIVLIIVGGMVMSMKRSMQAGALARDPDASPPRSSQPARRP